MKWLIVILFATVEGDIYVFENPSFETEKACREFIMDRQQVPNLTQKLLEEYVIQLSLSNAAQQEIMAEERLPSYEEKDLKLLRSKPIFTNFGDPRFKDCLELHIYSGENVLESNYGVDTFKIGEKATKNRAPSTLIDIHGDIRRMGYNTGTFGVKYNFMRKLVGRPDETLYIDEISGDRKEVRLRPRSIDAQLRRDFMSFGERMEGSVLSGHDWWPDVHLNFGQDELVLAVNFAMDYEAYPREPHSIIFKLYSLAFLNF